MGRVSSRIDSRVSPDEHQAAFGAGGRKARESQRRRRGRGGAGPAGGWVNGGIQYDPDKGLRPDDLNVPTLDFSKRFAAAPDDFPTSKITEDHVISVPGHGKYVPIGIGGQFLEWNKEGQRFKPRMIQDTKALKDFRESEAGKATTERLRESAPGFDFDVGGGNFVPPGGDSTVLWDTEFIPIMAGPYYKQLYIYDYLYMHARAFEQVNHSALAAAAVKIIVRFTLGRGLTFHIKDDQVREVWTDFWEANNMKEKIRLQGRDLTWQGEIMWKFHEPRRGFIEARPIDPSTCWEVVTDPENIDRVFYYHFQYPTPYQIWITGKIPVAKYVIQQIPPTNIQHLKINCSSQEKRGRSDLFAAMPWIKRFNDYYNGATVKAILEANLVNIIEVDGDESDVQRIRQDSQFNILPPPGGTWIQNKGVQLKPTSAQMTAGRGSSGIGQQLASVVACSLNLPAEYFNIESGGAARATALVRTDPAVKSMEDRQQVHREDLERIFDRVMASALISGRISKDKIRKDPELTNDGWQDGTQEPDNPIRAERVGPATTDERPAQRARIVRARG